MTARPSRFDVDGEGHEVRLSVPGRHNASNALAAIAATRALGIRVEDAVHALARFEGTKRRLETVGTANGVTVIDDFAHNPDKIDASLATLRAHPGRLLIMFQPHGYGPLAKMGEELADSFARGLAPDDRLYLPDPVISAAQSIRAAAPTGWRPRSRSAAAAPSTCPTAPPSAMQSWPRPPPATASSSWVRVTTH